MSRDDHVLAFEDIMASLLSQTPNTPDAQPVKVAQEPEVQAQNEVLDLLTSPEPTEIAGLPVPEQSVDVSASLATPSFVSALKTRLAALKGGA